MYEGDSFFTLSGGGQIGLICLTVVLTLVVVVAAWRLMQGRAAVVRLGIAVVLFAVFIWLSPQVYYAYYQLIFEGLPAQWVIGWPPLAVMMEYASFRGPANLSAHGQGALLWVLVGLALKGSARRDQTP